MGFYDFNTSARIAGMQNPVAKLAEAAVEVVTSVLDKPEESRSIVSQEEIDAAREKQTFGAYDYAKQYKPGEVYELKGVDSDIKSLDVAKAVSDMKLDTAIQQYQYFVKDTAAVSAGVASVRGAENFTL